MPDPPPPRAEAAFLDSLRLMALVSSGYILLALLAPVAFRRESTADAGRVAEIAWAHGQDSLSYFAKQPDKRHYLAGNDVFFGYRVVNRVAIVAGDPVGPAARIPEAIPSFVDLCRKNDWIPVFYEAAARHLPAYEACGLRSFKVGEEAVITLAGFSLQGSKIANVRHTVTKTEREAPDLRVVEYRREPPDPEVDVQLEEISEEWLAGKRGLEFGFNLGVFSVDQLFDKRTLIAVSGIGQVEAFVTWLPYRTGRAFVLDAMRRRNAAPYGVMDLLIARSPPDVQGRGDRDGQPRHGAAREHRRHGGGLTVRQGSEARFRALLRLLWIPDAVQLQEEVQPGLGGPVPGLSEARSAAAGRLRPGRRPCREHVAAPVEPLIRRPRDISPGGQSPRHLLRYINWSGCVVEEGHAHD